LTNKYNICYINKNKTIYKEDNVKNIDYLSTIGNPLFIRDKKILKISGTENCYYIYSTPISNIPVSNFYNYKNSESKFYGCLFDEIGVGGNSPEEVIDKLFKNNN